jgi:hypothetical protein
MLMVLLARVLVLMLVLLLLLHASPNLFHVSSKVHSSPANIGSPTPSQCVVGGGVWTRTCAWTVDRELISNFAHVTISLGH